MSNTPSTSDTSRKSRPQLKGVNATVASPPPGSLWESPSWLLELLLITAALCATAAVGSFFQVADLPLRCFRPSTGMAFVFLWYRGLDRWLAVLIGAMLAAVGFGSPMAAVPVVALGETATCVLSVWLVRRATSGRNPVERLRDSLAFVGWGVLLAPLVSSLVSTVILWRTSSSLAGQFVELFLVRWLAQALGAVLVAPVGLAWWPWKWTIRNRRQWLEVALFTSLLGLLGVWIFARHIGVESLPIPDVALVVPVCVWSLMRWGARGNSLTSLAICLMSILAALHDRGPFSRAGEFLVSSSLLLALGNSMVFGVTMWLASGLMVERRRTEIEIEKSDVRYRILFRNSPDAIFVADFDSGRLLEFNEQLPRLLKCSREDLLGRRREDFEADAIPVTDRSSVLSALKPKTIDYDTRYRCLNGEIIDVNLTYSVVDYSGQQAELMIARDVTARRRAEQQLRESEEKFRALAENIPLMVAIQREHVPLYVNPATASLSGYSLGELGRMDFVDLLRAEFRAEARYQVRSCLEKKTLSWRREVSLQTKTGQERQVDLSVTPISLEGRVAWLATALDVTERRKAETEVRQLNAELFHSARLRLLGAFVAGVAHDLKHPIGAVNLLATEMINLLHDGKPPTPQLLFAKFKMVLSETDRAVASLVRLQDLSRRHETDRRWIELAPLISDAMRLIKLNREWSDVPIYWFPDVRRVRAFADRAEITQVLLDLLRNGMEAMDDMPTHERKLTIHLGRHEPGWLKLSITDHGHGVPEEFVPKLFTAFNTTKSEGLGLGLSLCHTIIEERHEGKLSYEAATPRGSTFRILLRADEE